MLFLLVVDCLRLGAVVVVVVVVVRLGASCSDSSPTVATHVQRHTLRSHVAVVTSHLISHSAAIRLDFLMGPHFTAWLAGQIGGRVVGAAVVVVVVGEVVVVGGGRGVLG